MPRKPHAALASWIDDGGNEGEKKKSSSPRAALSVQDDASAEAEDSRLLSSYQAGGGGGGSGGARAASRGARAGTQRRVDEWTEAHEAGHRVSAAARRGGGRRLSLFDSTATHLYQRKRDTQIAMINANPERWGGAMPAQAGKSEATRGGGQAAQAVTAAAAQYEDEEPKPPFPRFCFLIVLANCAALARCVQLEDWQLQPMSVNPMLGPSAKVLTDMGAKVTTMIVKDGQWWRLASAMFLHGGVIHLFANMFGMWREGGRLEQEFGWWRVAVVYVLGGLSGNVCSSVFLPAQITVGASGAVFALFGAIWAEFLNHMHYYGGYDCFATFFSLLLSTAFNLCIGLMPLVDNFAHVGGFIAGFFAGCILMLQPEVLPNGATKEPTAVQKCLGMTGLVGLTTLVIVATFCLYFEVDFKGWCKVCEYVNCVDTRWWDCDSAGLGNCKSGQQMPNGVDAQVICADGVKKLAKNFTMASQADLKTACLAVCAT